MPVDHLNNRRTNSVAKYHPVTPDDDRIYHMGRWYGPLYEFLVSREYFGCKKARNTFVLFGFVILTEVVFFLYFL